MRRARLLLFAAGLLLGGVPAARAACDATAPFDLPYRIAYGDLPIGSGSMSVFAEHRGCAVFRLLAHPDAALRWLIGGLEDESHFCVDADGIRPTRFSHVRAGNHSESYALAFDWAAARVRGGRFKEAALPPGALDPLSVQLQVRDWLCRSTARGGALPEAPLAVLLVDHKGVRRYLLKVAAEETIEVPAGRFATVRVDRIDADRQGTRFWLARDHQFLIVRAQQRRGQQPALRVELAALPAAAAAE